MVDSLAIEAPLKASRYFSIIGGVGLLVLLLSKTLYVYVFLSLSALILTITSIFINGVKFERYQVYVLLLSILFALLALLFHFISSIFDQSKVLFPYILVTYLVGITILNYLDKMVQK